MSYLPLHTTPHSTQTSHRQWPQCLLREGFRQQGHFPAAMFSGSIIMSSWSDGDYAPHPILRWIQGWATVQERLRCVVN